MRAALLVRGCTEVLATILFFNLFLAVLSARVDACGVTSFAKASFVSLQAARFYFYPCFEQPNISTFLVFAFVFIGSFQIPHANLTALHLTVSESDARGVPLVSLFSFFRMRKYFS